jgi:hypothetical protein
MVIVSCSYADIIIPWQRGDNLVAIDLITQHICSKLRCHDLLRIYPNLELLPSNFQVKAVDKTPHMLQYGRPCYQHPADLQHAHHLCCR